jgi:hypothetical protein
VLVNSILRWGREIWCASEFGSKMRSGDMVCAGEFSSKMGSGDMVCQ